MKCIRVHRARRQRHARIVGSLGVALSMVATARVAAAQSPYPPAPYPGYPAPPQYPPQPQYPQYPPQPQYPPIPQPGMPGQPPLPQQPGAMATYRTPVLALAQPAEGVVLPDDKPVVVFRFAQADPRDPIDALSFSVSVGGIDRTPLFALSDGEAWGPLAPVGELLSAGQHEVRARICSARGACGVVKGTVTVVAGGPLQDLAASVDRATAEKKERRTRIIDAVLQAARVLIRP